jgi:hypothetical protein
MYTATAARAIVEAGMPPLRRLRLLGDAAGEPAASTLVCCNVAKKFGKP